jgi:choline dehydrogenase-like flavoprotein
VDISVPMQRQFLGLPRPNMTLRPFSVVHSILYDEQKGKSAVGVRVIDSNTKEEIDFYAKLIFVNAAAINTNLILLNSKSNRFPNGLGNDSGVLGKYVAFHNYSARIYAEYEGCWILRPKGGIPQVEGIFHVSETCTNRKRTF